MKTIAVAASFLLASGVAGVVFDAKRLVPPPVPDNSFKMRMLGSDATVGEAVFEQLIDHKNASLGTFPQRYYYNNEFWAGPGSPVVFFTPGESAFEGYEGYTSTQTLPGLFAQAIGGAIVVVEHRYWGQSTPFDKLTTKNMQYLTLENAIRDTTYFAKNVRLPFDANGTSSADNAPWVMSGGSYSGALTAWVASVDPSTYWAYHASSAVVETIGDFWQYFAPVQQGMPKNCSADVIKVVELVDHTLKTGTDDEKTALKAKFGLQSIEHDDDFAR